MTFHTRSMMRVSTLLLAGGLTSLSAAIVAMPGIATAAGAPVYAWGTDGAGEPGNGTNTDSIVPVTANTPPGISSISAGADHSLASSFAVRWHQLCGHPSNDSRHPVHDPSGC